VARPQFAERLDTTVRIAYGTLIIEQEMVNEGNGYRVLLSKTWRTAPEKVSSLPFYDEEVLVAFDQHTWKCRLYKTKDDVSVLQGLDDLRDSELESLCDRPTTLNMRRQGR
jgi:hypothetical protein